MSVQRAINKSRSKDDHTSSKWAQTFLHNSSTRDLRERVDAKYKSLKLEHQGGVTYLYLQLKIMFHMTRETIQALKKYLKLFEEKGLKRIRGENVTVAEKEVVATKQRMTGVERKTTRVEKKTAGAIVDNRSQTPQRDENKEDGEKVEDRSRRC